MAEGILKIEKIISQLGSISEIIERLLSRSLRVLTYSPVSSISHKKVFAFSVEKGSVSVAYGSSLLSRVRVKGIRSFIYDNRFPSPEEVAAAAMAVLGPYAKGREVDLVIPKSWTVLKVAEFPLTVKENLGDVISYEMDRLTPFSPEDVFYDYRVVREEDNKIVILIVATKKDTVRPYIEALREKGLGVRRLSTSLSAIGALSFYSWKKGSTVFLEIGKDSYEAGLFEGPLVVDYLSGDFDREDDKERVERIFGELQSLLERARSSGSTPEILLLLRDGNLKEILKARINYPFRILGETDIGIRLPSTRDISYTVLGGLIESLSKEEGLNLLSSGKRERQRVPISLTLILLVAIATLGAVYFTAPLRIEGRRLHAIDEQIAQKKAEAMRIESLKKEVEDLRSEIGSINNFKEGRISSLAILKEMTMTLPKNTWLTRFRVTEKNIDIEGYAGSATELLPKLEASKYFKKAEFSSPTFRDARMNADRFIIKMEIELPEVKVEKK